MPSIFPSASHSPTEQDDIDMVNAPETITPSTTTGSVARSLGSVFQSHSIQAVDVPFEVINRPLPSELDEDKVQRFMKDIQNGDEFTPLEVFRVVADDGRRYYLSFGGCHRYEAHKRLGSATVRGRVINVPPSMIRQHLGASCPF
ncbi:ParB/Sulfiredoxin [Leucosporidium creatinivorum]|uniref:sulfiredoxin n=1 Tax=Leucosporidium creatinivorum TaxID=106004 RepID=A0A1Y2G2M5_9BASI|nr:ParB/Sulfiredoxin [Leucosporidium creatinivorum]